MREVHSNYRDKDDAIHIYKAPDYYEWWYCDAQFDNGYSCVIVYHWLCGFLKPRIPTVTKNIYTPDGGNISSGKAFQPGECSASEDKCDVKLGESYICQKGNTYEIYAPGKKSGAHLVFKRLLPGWKPKGTGYLYDKNRQKQGWLVPVPRAEVTGKLIVDGKEINVKGFGYHDHNWSNVNMYDSFRSWFWGRLHHPEYTLIYYYLYPTRSNEPVESRLYLAKGDRVILTPDNFHLEATGAQTEPVTGIPVPRKLSIQAKNGDTALKFEVAAHDIFDCNQLTLMAPWPVYYWRFKADYKAEIKIGAKTENLRGSTMSEYMLLR